jgi:hypothetical protein
MTTTMLGADADELERLAGTLRSAADELDGHAGSVTTTLRSVAWVGGVATRFGVSWNGSHRPRIASTAHYVRDAAARLDRNAAEQRRASRSVGGAVVDPARAGPPSGPNSSGAAPGLARGEYVDRIERLLEGLGLTHAQIEIVADLADRLGEQGAIGTLIDVLTGDAFAAFLDGAGDVLDAGSVIVDAVTDFAEHPGLAFDDRIVHALADTAVRFGLNQGMEFAAEWLAGAATTALLPGFGVVLAPFVGDVAGAVAGRLMDVAVDGVDAATDIVDTIADAAVAAYQDVKAVVGVVADVAEAAVEVVGGAMDLAGDAAGAVIDAGGAVIGTGADLAGDVVGALNPFD